MTASSRDSRSATAAAIQPEGAAHASGCGRPGVRHAPMARGFAASLRHRPRHSRGERRRRHRLAGSHRQGGRRRTIGGKSARNHLQRKKENEVRNNGSRHLFLPQRFETGCRCCLLLLVHWIGTTRPIWLRFVSQFLGLGEIGVGIGFVAFLPVRIAPNIECIPIISD